MNGEVWVATRDFDEANLKVRAGAPLPDRFQSRHCVQEQLMPYYGKESFKLTTPRTENHDANELAALRSEVAQLKASNERLAEKIEALLATTQAPKGVKPAQLNQKPEG